MCLLDIKFMILPYKQLPEYIHAQNAANKKSAMTAIYGHCAFNVINTKETLQPYPSASTVILSDAVTSLKSLTWAS